MSIFKSFKENLALYTGIGWEDLVKETEEERTQRVKEESAQRLVEEKAKEQKSFKEDILSRVKTTSRFLRNNSDLIPNPAYKRSWEMLEDYKSLVKDMSDIHELSVLQHKRITDVLSEYLPELVEKYRLIAPERRMEGSEAAEEFLNSIDLFSRLVKTAHEELKDSSAYDFLTVKNSIEKILAPSVLDSANKKKELEEGN